MKGAFNALFYANTTHVTESIMENYSLGKIIRNNLPMFLFCLVENREYRPCQVCASGIRRTPIINFNHPCLFYVQETGNAVPGRKLDR
jgi:hypothetical protein